MFNSLRTVLMTLGSITLLGVTDVAQAETADDVACINCVDTRDIAYRAVTGRKLSPNAVSTGKITAGAVTTAKIRDLAVTTNKIQDGAVSIGKLDSQLVDFVNGSIGGLILEQTSLSDGSGVAALLCPSNSLIASANCNCDSVQGTRNYGVLFGCQVAGNGGVAGCFNEAGTFNPFLPDPLATITLVCVSAVQNDGTQIVPTPIAVKPSGMSKIEKGGVDFETAENATRAAAAAQRSVLQNR